MRLNVRLSAVAAGLAIALVAPTSVSATPAGLETFTWTQNMKPLGASPNPIDPGIFNSDLAFWGNRAYQGTYDGFRILDVSSPAQPREVVDWRECASAVNDVPSGSGNQGDIVAWGGLHAKDKQATLIVRAWNSPTPAAGRNCGELPMTQNQEGVHVIDIRDEANPKVVGYVDLPGCGSHTLTLVPDLKNQRLLIYSSASSAAAACQGIHIVSVPLDASGTALGGTPQFLHLASSGNAAAGIAGRACHDTGVILGSVMKVACSGGNGFTMWDLNPNDLANPVFRYSRTMASVGVSGVTIGHTASFTWDGKVFIFGHEPGGGGQAQCQATTPIQNRTMFFFDTDSGTLLGGHVLPRPQGPTENCTIHNLNAVPLPKQGNRSRYVLVHGSYQSGIGVVDFSRIHEPYTDLYANETTEEIAYADPAPLNDDVLVLGGDWSSYWYNGRIYQSDITRGVFIWNLASNRVAGAMNLHHLNPQTQEISFD